MPGRDELHGTGSIHYCCAHAAPASRPLAEGTEPLRFLAHLEQVRTVFQARIYAYALREDAVHLALQLPRVSEDRDQALFDRWRQLARRAPPPPERLRRRFGSVSGFMQTLLQRFARSWNARRRARGPLWSPRFRSVLLADDCALLAATTWIERRAGGGGASSRGHHDRDAPITLSLPPLLLGPGDFISPTDEAPPGCHPPADGELEHALERFAEAISPEALEAYGRALDHGWALGRPESLVGVLERVGRTAGRGRGRRLHDLGDEYGLCGVWG